MSVIAQTIAVLYSCTGATSFPVPFKYVNKSYIKVIRIPLIGVESLLVEGVDYTVTGDGETGTVTTLATYTDGQLRVYRDTPAERPTDYDPYAPAPMDQVDADLDKAYMILQERIGIADRAMAAPSGETMDMTIPSESLRGGKLLGFDPVTKQPIATDPSGSVVPVSTMTDSLLDIPNTHAVKTYSDAALDVEASARVAGIATAKTEIRTEDWDIIIDSNAKLDQWIAHTGGLLKRVLIRAGTFTTDCSTVYGRGISLTLSGTKFIYGEPGSLIVLNNQSVSAGMFYDVVPSGNDFLIYGLNITVNNPGSSSAPYGLKNCINISNSIVTMNSAASYNASAIYLCSKISNTVAVCDVTNTNSYSASGFSSCTDIINSKGTGTKNATGGGLGQGFDNCINLINCYGYGVALASASGFISCSMLTNCVGDGVSSSGNNAGVGFWACKGLKNCVGTGTGIGSSGGNGFRDCVRVSSCVGRGKGGTIPYSFFNCKKTIGCTASSAGGYATGVYNTSYADALAAAACADTAAGGWNDISTTA